MTYFNAQGQGRVGWKSGVSAAPAPVTVSTLLTSLYSVWNGDTTSSTLDSSIYGAWNGENNANDSVGTNHGTLMNGCTFTTGKVGQAFSFDGVNDYVALPDNSLNLTGDFTISVWVYPTAGTPQSILDNLAYAGGTVYKGWQLDINNVSGAQSYKVTFSIGQGTSGSNYTGWEYSTTALTPNAWNHILIKRVSGVNTYCWVNNISQSYVLYGTGKDITLNPTYHTTQYVTIGSYKLLSGAIGSYLANGSKVDGVTVWNKALTDDERTQLYNLGTGTQYPFSGQTLPSANNQFAIDNGTLMNGCTFTDGKIGKAFTFDGVNDYVQLPNNSLNFTGDFAISVWIYPTSGNVQCLLDNLALDNTSLYKGWQFDINNISGAQSGKITFTIPQTYTTYTGWQFNTTALTLNSWNHVLIQRVSGVNTYCWVNGVSQTYTLSGPGADITKDPIYHTTQIVTLGSFKKLDTSIGNLLKNGTKIDGLSVWKKVLTQSEITELYNSGAGKQLTVATPIVTNGLVLNLDASRLSSYPNAGTTWTDISGNGNNGTMTNGPTFGTASGGQITFDGVNDYAATSYINTSNKFTIQTWVKISKYGGYENSSWKRAGLVNNGWNYINNQGFSLLATSQYGPNKVATIGKEWVGLTIGTDQYGAFTTGGYMSPYVDNWVNIVAVVNGTNPIKLYVNGVEPTYSIQQNGPADGVISYTGDLSIGKTNNQDYLLGSMGDVRIYTRPLSQTEITQNYNATKSRFGL